MNIYNNKNQHFKKMCCVKDTCCADGIVAVDGAVNVPFGGVGNGGDGGDDDAVDVVANVVDDEHSDATYLVSMKANRSN